MATITTTVSGNSITFNVINSSVTPWRAYIAAKTDHGLGMAGQGTGDYPYFVGTIDGVGNNITTKTYTNDQYSAELWEQGGTFLDAALFTVVSAPPTKWTCEGAPDYLCHADVNGTYTTQAECLSKCKSETPPSDIGKILMYVGISITVGYFAYKMLKKK